jgi:hypothetical protein
MPALTRSSSSRFNCAVIRLPAATARGGGRCATAFLCIAIFFFIGFGGAAEVVIGGDGAAGAGAAADGIGAAGAAGGGAADGAGAAGALGAAGGVAAGGLVCAHTGAAMASAPTTATPFKRCFMLMILCRSSGLANFVLDALLA